ncbi:integrase core domain-containing protein [Kitasatospora sp. NPDC086801]|uniref:integrase core domain-containing protein n=1 Tax=Kitasatospora sp. NPDC086801 TaxID=3364066 RepID=UPI00381AE890
MIGTGERGLGERMNAGATGEPRLHRALAVAQLDLPAGRVGSSYDNALAESLWQSLKREALFRTLFSTMEQARMVILRWLTYYNARRRHSALAYLSPMEFEQQQRTTAKLSLAA